MNFILWFLSSNFFICKCKLTTINMSNIKVAGIHGGSCPCCGDVFVLNKYGIM